MSEYDRYLLPPRKNDNLYYLEDLYNWVPIDENLELDLSKCSQPGDVIDDNNRDKLLWYYNPTAQRLFIPTKNAAKILIYQYNNDPENPYDPLSQPFCPPLESAKLWLRCLGFCGAFVSVGTKSIYAGIKGVNVTEKVQHCHEFDLSLTPNQRLDNQPTQAEVDAMKAHHSNLYATPTNWLARREANIQVLEAYPELPPTILTSKQAFARKQQMRRLEKQYGGKDTEEFHRALALYDKGVRRVPDSHAKRYSQELVARRTHARLIELLQTAGGVHYDETSALSIAQHTAPIDATLTKNEFYSQKGFGALSSTFNTTTRPLLPGTQYPVAFVWDARRVHILGEDLPPQLEIKSIAVAIGWLQHPERLPEYTRAYSYVSTRVIPLALQHKYGYHQVAIFTNPAYMPVRKRSTKRRDIKHDQRIAELEARIIELSARLK